MFDKILIANRGEIACRIARTARQMGIATVAVYSSADRHAQHVRLCDQAYCIGAAPASESYLRADKILEVALASGAQALHPGYGFLSENAAFATACATAGIVFIGPPVEAIAAMGSKSEAKRIMQQAAVTLVPGYHGDDQGDQMLATESLRIGFPQLIKASAGGGGKGMRVVQQASEFPAALTSARREAQASFGDDRVLIERYLVAPRHVEVQVFADSQGNVVHLFERDCSIQRRHQKIIEEAPAPGINARLRAQMGKAAINCAQAIKYVGAGTVEFLLDADGSFYFMEMNTRLQVEHAVTECITGLDLVRWQILVADGEPLPLAQKDIKCYGHAFELRIYAEAPERDFLPATGSLKLLRTPDTSERVRIDSGVVEGDEIGVHYDPMIAKLIVHGEDREDALTSLRRALEQYQVLGLQTNIGFLARVVSLPEFAAANINTGFIAQHRDELFDNTADTPWQLPLLVALALLSSQQNSGASPWRVADGWRMNQRARHRLRFQYESQDYSVEASPVSGGWQMQYNDNSYLLSGGVNAQALLEAELDGERLSLPCVLDDAGVSLWYAQRQWQFDRRPLAQSSSAGAADSGDLRAPMPGNVIALSVLPGDEVKTGDALIVIEAMKMEHTITAPIDGRVKKVFFQLGSQVEEGDHLIILE